MTHLTDFLCLLARHDTRGGLADHKWVVTLLQRAQKALALLGQIRPSASFQHLPDTAASRCVLRLAE